MDTDTDEAPPLPNAFLPLIHSCEDGVLLAELSDRTRELIGAMYQQQMARGTKPRGSLTLKLDFLLDGDHVEVRADVATKEPKAERARSIFWHLHDHGLSPNNPKQLHMDLAPRTVDLATSAPRRVG